MLRSDRLLNLLALAMLTQLGTAQVCGDCDGDGRTSIADALLAAQHTAGRLVITPPQFQHCNVVGVLGPPPTGAVNVLDALEIAKFAAGLLTVLQCTDPPECTVMTPMPAAPAGDIPIDWKAIDHLSRLIDTCQGEYSRNAGVTWMAATPGPGGSGLTAIPAEPRPGTNQLFVWASRVDGVGVTTAETVLFRLRVARGSEWSRCQTSTFCVDNQPAIQGTWRQIFPDPPLSPPGRRDHSMVYDSLRGRMIVFAGQTEWGQQFNDVWAFDCATNVWTELHPAGDLPPSRYQHSAEFDRHHDRMVTFGGIWCEGSGCGGRWDAWELSFAGGSDGAWRDLGVVDYQYTFGGPRTSHVFVDDGVRMSILSEHDPDVWPMSTMRLMRDTALVEFDLRNPMIVVGLFPGSRVGAPGIRPPVMWEHPAVYDPIANRVVMTGGMTPPFTQVPGAWEFQFLPSGNGVWSRLQQCGRPLHVHGVEFAYDSSRHLALVYSGSHILGDPSPPDSTVAMDLGVLTHAHFKSVDTPGLTPGARTSHTMQRDTVHDRFILFGGRGSASPHFDDTWELRLQ